MLCIYMYVYIIIGLSIDIFTNGVYSGDIQSELHLFSIPGWPVCARMAGEGPVGGKPTGVMVWGLS